MGRWRMKAWLSGPAKVEPWCGGLVEAQREVQPWWSDNLGGVTTLVRWTKNGLWEEGEVEYGSTEVKQKTPLGVFCFEELLLREPRSAIKSIY